MLHDALRFQNMQYIEWDVALYLLRSRTALRIASFYQQHPVRCTTTKAAMLQYMSDTAAVRRKKKATLEEDVVRSEVLAMTTQLNQLTPGQFRRHLRSHLESWLQEGNDRTKAVYRHAFILHSAHHKKTEILEATARALEILKQ